MTATTTLRAQTYYPWFDWLRIALACIVMLTHAGLMAWHHAGNFAVQVFFALSGWLIGGVLLSTKSKDIPRFYFNRALRIWVPYFIGLLLIIAASLLHDAITHKWFEFIFYKFTFVYNLFGTQQLAQYTQLMPLQGTGNHFWSVNAEEQFYLLAPLLLVFAPSRFGHHVYTWLLIALLAWLSQYYASIVFGVTAAIIVKQYGAIHLSKFAKLIFIGVVASSFYGFMLQLNYMLIAPFCAIAIVMLLAIQGQQTPIGKFVGGMSYPLYLNQWVGVFVINAIYKHFNLQEPISKHLLIIALSLLVAAALYWWVDRRILVLRPSLYTPTRAKLVTKYAYASLVLGICVGFYLQN